MQYKISFIDLDGREFMGTMEHFTTDGRYSLQTVDEVARDTARKSLKREQIMGYNVRKNSFNSAIVATVFI